MTGGKRRALLVSGGVNQKLNHPRYRNDLERWCSGLLDRGFHCAVCYADGSNFPLSDICVGPATKNQITAEFAKLKTLGDDDIVLILVTNHGDRIGFGLWGGALFTPKELASALAPCRAMKVVVMGQCFGGVFSSLNLDRTIWITASGATETSWACAEPPGPKSYDEFLYQFALALFGSSSGASAVAAASRPTLQAAFEQARVSDRRPETPSITDKAGLAPLIVL